MTARSQATALLRREDDETPIDGTSWIGPLTDADREIVRQSRGPVLDVGCGPGRHVLALARDGKVALGIDLTRAAVDLARSRGAPVLHRSVFARIPGAGRWRTALLLDGNVGIGGDPATLLRRVAELVTLDGDIYVELHPAGGELGLATVRLELGTRAGPWFEWSPLPVDALSPVALCAGVAIQHVWTRQGRWFAALRPSRGHP